MKTTISILSFSLVILLSISNLTAQECNIGIGKSFQPKDTLRTFYLNTMDVDKSIESLITLWNTPIKESAGFINWENVNIPNYGNVSKIVLFDGYSSTPNKVTTIKSFSSYTEKVEKLRNMQEYESRVTYLTFKDENGNNIANTYQLEKLIKGYLTNLLIKE